MCSAMPQSGLAGAEQQNLPPMVMQNLTSLRKGVGEGSGYFSHIALVERGDIECDVMVGFDFIDYGE